MSPTCSPTFIFILLRCLYLNDSLIDRIRLFSTNDSSLDSRTLALVAASHSSSEISISSSTSKKSSISPVLIWAFRSFSREWNHFSGLSHFLSWSMSLEWGLLLYICCTLSSCCGQSGVPQPFWSLMVWSILQILFQVCNNYIYFN